MYKKPKPLGRKTLKNCASDIDKPLLEAIVPFEHRKNPNETLVVRVGPLRNIRRSSSEAKARDMVLRAALGGDDVIRIFADMLSRENSAEDIAAVLYHFVAWYAATALGHSSELAWRPYTFSHIIEAVKHHLPNLFDVVAEKFLVRAYDYMREALYQREASLREVGYIPVPVIVGNYWTTRLLFVSEFGKRYAVWVEEQAFQSAIKVLGFTFLAAFAPDFRPQRALEFVIGVCDRPDWFLASEVDLALRRDDLLKAKQLIMDPGTFNHANLKAEHVYTFGEILAEPHWKTADSPLHYVPAAVSKALSKQSLEERRDQLKARRARLVRVDPDSAYADESVVAPSGSWVNSTELDFIARSDLEHICDDAQLPAELRSVVRAKFQKRKQDRLGDIPELSGWSERKIASANQLLKSHEKWGTRLTRSDIADWYRKTPPAQRYMRQTANPAAAARPHTRGMMAGALQDERSGIDTRAEYVRSAADRIFGKRLQSFDSDPKPSGAANNPSLDGDVRIFVQNGTLTPAGERANIKVRP